ncbi:MAG: competence protein ComEA [Candidatus Rokuibacteriota bacterium]|nr:MAG: competence protein ComEA [Candidatus Rokubacteria bacterium]PYM66884.1 MAG: competence protein ComEA [Candidatus Rokubacteria bacterium]PYN67048.1 MAG: competence protein ComEA [Candidatus Rokubacteria bacterium]
MAREHSSDCRERGDREPESRGGTRMIRRSALSVVLLIATVSVVPWPAEAAQHLRTEPPNAAQTAGGMININTADVKELMQLEGVGRRVAEKIVEYREHHGLFQKPEEIRRVEGIGSGLWERNRARIVVK